MEIPIFVRAFYEPINNSEQAQVALTAVLILIVLDLLIGMFAAWLNKEFSSTKIREGLAHKCAELIFLIIADVVDALVLVGVKLPFDIDAGPAMLATCVTLIVMEVSSLLEIAVRIYPKLADFPVFRRLNNPEVEDRENGQGEQDA